MEIILGFIYLLVFLSQCMFIMFEVMKNNSDYVAFWS